MDDDREEDFSGFLERNPVPDDEPGAEQAALQDANVENEVEQSDLPDTGTVAEEQEQQPSFSFEEGELDGFFDRNVPNKVGAFVGNAVHSFNRTMGDIAATLNAGIGTLLHERDGVNKLGIVMRGGQNVLDANADFARKARVGEELLALDNGEVKDISDDAKKFLSDEAQRRVMSDPSGFTMTTDEDVAKEARKAAQSHEWQQAREDSLKYLQNRARENGFAFNPKSQRSDTWESEFAEQMRLSDMARNEEQHKPVNELPDREVLLHSPEQIWNQRASDRVHEAEAAYNAHSAASQASRTFFNDAISKNLVDINAQNEYLHNLGLKYGGEKGDGFLGRAGETLERMLVDVTDQTGNIMLQMAAQGALGLAAKASAAAQGATAVAGGAVAEAATSLGMADVAMAATRTAAANTAKSVGLQAMGRALQAGFIASEFQGAMDEARDLGIPDAEAARHAMEYGVAAGILENAGQLINVAGLNGKTVSKFGRAVFGNKAFSPEALTTLAGTMKQAGVKIGAKMIDQVADATGEGLEEITQTTAQGMAMAAVIDEYCDRHNLDKAEFLAAHDGAPYKIGEDGTVRYDIGKAVEEIKESGLAGAGSAIGTALLGAGRSGVMRAFRGRTAAVAGVSAVTGLDASRIEAVYGDNACEVVAHALAGVKSDEDVAKRREILANEVSDEDYGDDALRLFDYCIDNAKVTETAAMSGLQSKFQVPRSMNDGWEESDGGALWSYSNDGITIVQDVVNNEITVLNDTTGQAVKADSPDAALAAANRYSIENQARQAVLANRVEYFGNMMQRLAPEDFKRTSVYMTTREALEKEPTVRKALIADIGEDVIETVRGIGGEEAVNALLESKFEGGTLNDGRIVFAADKMSGPWKMMQLINHETTHSGILSANSWDRKKAADFIRNMNVAKPQGFDAEAQRGFRGLTESQRNSFTWQFWMRMERIKRNLGYEEGSPKLMEETIAYFFQDRANRPSMWSRMKHALFQTLRDNAGRNIALQESDIEVMVDAWRHDSNKLKNAEAATETPEAEPMPGATPAPETETERSTPAPEAGAEASPAPETTPAPETSPAPEAPVETAEETPASETEAPAATGTETAPAPETSPATETAPAAEEPAPAEESARTPAEWLAEKGIKIHKGTGVDRSGRPVVTKDLETVDGVLNRTVMPENAPALSPATRKALIGKLNGMGFRVNDKSSDATLLGNLLEKYTDETGKPAATESKPAPEKEQAKPAPKQEKSGAEASAAGEKPATASSTFSVITPDGEMTVEGKWEAVPADKIVTSFDPRYKQFEKHMQNRITTGKTNEQKVEKYANGPLYRMAGNSEISDTGAAFGVWHDGLCYIVAGNHHTRGIQLSFERGKGGQFEADARADMERRGVKVPDGNFIPIRIIDGMTREQLVEFSDKSNQRATQEHRDGEKAVKDVPIIKKHISKLHADAELTSRDNIDFVEALLKEFKDESLRNSDLTPNDKAYRRVRLALVASVLSATDEDAATTLAQVFAEKAESLGLQNIIDGVTRAAAPVLSATEAAKGTKLDFGQHLAEALRAIVDFKQSGGKSMKAFLAQDGLDFGDKQALSEEGKMLAQAIAENVNAPQKISALLTDVATRVEKAATDAAQAGLFANEEAPSLGKIISASVEAASGKASEAEVNALRNRAPALFDALWKDKDGTTDALAEVERQINHVRDAKDKTSALRAFTGEARKQAGKYWSAEHPTGESKLRHGPVTTEPEAPSTKETNNEKAETVPNEAPAPAKGGRVEPAGTEARPERVEGETAPRGETKQVNNPTPISTAERLQKMTENPVTANGERDASAVTGKIYYDAESGLAWKYVGGVGKNKSQVRLHVYQRRVAKVAGAKRATITEYLASPDYATLNEVDSQYYATREEAEAAWNELVGKTAEAPATEAQQPTAKTNSRIVPGARVEIDTTSGGDINAPQHISGIIRSLSPDGTRADVAYRDGNGNIEDRVFEIGELSKAQIDSSMVTGIGQDGRSITSEDYYRWKRETEGTHVDRQGNPVHENGELKLDVIGSLSDLTDEDFTAPTRNVQLPEIPANIDAAIGANGKPVIIKRNIFERNATKHGDLTPAQSRDILKSALYSPDLYGQNQKASKPYRWILINTKDSNGKNRLVLLEVSENKNHVEIVHWHFIDDRGIEKIKKQAAREDGQLLILPSAEAKEAGALSSPTRGEVTQTGNSIAQPEAKVKPAPKATPAPQAPAAQPGATVINGVEFSADTMKELSDLMDKIKVSFSRGDVDSGIRFARGDVDADTVNNGNRVVTLAVKSGVRDFRTFATLTKQFLSDMEGERRRAMQNFLAARWMQYLMDEPDSGIEDISATRARAVFAEIENEQPAPAPETTTETPQNQEQNNEAPSTNETREEASERPDVEPEANPVEGTEAQPEPQESVKEEAKTQKRAPATAKHTVVGKSLAPAIASAPTTRGARLAANIEAIRIAKDLDATGREATEEEREKLAKFTGWGGLGGVFDNDAEMARLQEVLTSEEINAAELSANSAYFTPQNVTDALWNIARALGFKGGKMLEGSAGVGNIISAIPEDMRAGTDVRAVEIDPITSLILKGLHPKIEVDNAGFQDVNIPAGSVQLAITNVPFVTGLRVYDKANKDLSDKFNDLHDFCIAKNIRALAEGGFGIFITTSNTLDKSDALRRWITSEGNADVIGAFRLPNNTFGGTAVTSDIIVVRKRVGGRTAPGAIDVSISSNERTGETYDRYGRPVFATMYLNQYFHDHPEMMGGEMAFNFEKGETYRATSYGLFPSPSIDANARLADFVKGMEAKRTDASQDENEAERERHTFKLEDETIHEGELHVAPNGEVAIARDGESVPLDMKSMKNKVAGVNGKDKYTRATVVKDYSGIKASLHALLDAQKEADRADADITQLLEKFNAAYDEFVKKYGPLNLNNRINWLDRDIYWPELCALETIKQDTNPSNEGYVATIRNEKDGIYTHIGKSDVFNKRVIAVEKTQKPATVTDAVLLDYRDTARVDAGNVAKMLGISKEDATEQILKSGLAFIDPATGSLAIRHDYLSGNVREKLAIAQAQNEDGRFDENIRALNEVMPPTIPAHLIGYTLGSTWIPTHVYTKYFSDRFDVNVAPENIGGQWIVDVPRYASGKDWDAGVHSSMAGKRISGSQIAAAAMKGQSTIPVTKTTEVMGEKKTIHDKAAEATISAKIDEIRDDFKAFVQKMARDDEAFAAEVEKIYNEKFNNLAKRVIDERFLPDHFPGAAPDVNLYPHQKRAVILGTTQPVMLAHEVGSGKTYTLITTAMEMRRLGTARKPMVVVQNATIGQFVASAKRLYPAARILAPSKSDCTVEGRKEFYAKIKFNDWDMIIIPQSVFGLIPDSDDSEMAYLTEKIEEKRKTLEGLSASGADKRTMAQAQKELKELGERFNAAKGRKDAKKKAKAQALADEKVKERVKKLLDRKVDDVETFEDMGIDALLIDEAHNYKRLGFETTLTGRNSRVKGIDTATGPKTTSAYMKIRHILSTQNGRNVVMATGTPISNTAAEIFTFMRYLMPLEMRRQYGLEYFDDFVHNFGDISQLLEFTTSGDFKENTRFAGYFNTAELVRLWQTVSDTVLAKNTEVNASLPEISGGEAQDMFLPQTPTLIGTMKRIRQMLKDYEQMSGKEKMAHSDIPLRAFGLAKAAAIDARLLDPTANDEPGSKTNRAVEIVLEDLEATKEHKGTVAVFCDRIKHQTGGKVDFNLFEDMKQKLIARGVPAGQIAIIEGRSMSDAKKMELFDKIKAGEIRVVFGSTETLGTGVNIQERLHMAIHMDAPPRPMDYTQRNGRILRQGNQWKLWNEPVRIVRFGVEDTLDVSAYQRLKTKAGFINSVMGLAARDQFDAMESRSIEDAEEDGVFDNPVAMLSGSQYALLKNKAERDLRKLRAKKESYEADQIYTKRQLDYIPGFIKGAEKKIAENKAELDKLGFGENGVRTIELDGEKFDVGDEDGIGKKLSADFNKQLVAARKEAQGISLSDTYYKALQLPIKADGVEFVVEAIVQAQKAWDADSRDWVVHSSTTIGWISPALDIKELREVKGQWPLAAIEDIAQYTKGEGLRREIAKNEDNIKYYREHEKSLRARYGIPFAEEEALKETEARVADYEQKMKAELAEKAKKYAEAEASAQGVDIDEVGDMDAAFSRGDDESGMRLSRGDEDMESEGYFGNERYNGLRFDMGAPAPVAVQPLPDTLREIADVDVRFSRREEEPPVKTGIGYKVFFLKDGKLYPPMVANPGGADTPVDVWLNADEGVRAEKSKNGRDKVKAGGKGTQGGGGTLAWRPGWHLGTIPYALQFNRGEKVDNPLGIKNQKGEVIKVGRYFPANFIWAEVEYAADVDYQEEAMSYGITPNGKFQHSLAGLPRLPKDGFYMYRTNANPATDPWIITGAMKVKRILTNEEVDEIVRQAGREPQEREPGASFSRGDEEAQNAVENAFGTTVEWNKAGYILNNGHAVDMSNGQADRTLDHRVAVGAIPHDLPAYQVLPREIERWAGFLGTGAIRLIGGDITIMREPTAEQDAALESFFSWGASRRDRLPAAVASFGPSVEVLSEDGAHQDYINFDASDSPEAVVRRIHQYFEARRGDNYQSPFADFRFSRGDESRFEVTPEEAAAIRALDIHGGKNYLVGASHVARFYTQHEYSPERLTKEKAWEESFGIDAPALVSEIVKKPRVLTPYEHAAMVRHLASYEARLDALTQKQNELERTPGTPTETLATLDNEIAVLGGAIQTIYTAFDYAGTKAGQALAFRNLIQNAEMTAGWMIRRMKKQMDDFHVDTMPAGFMDELERFATDYKRAKQDLEVAQGELVRKDAEAAQMNEILHNLRNRPKKDPVTRLNAIMAQAQDLVDAQGELSDYQIEKLVKKVAAEYVALDGRYRDVDTLLDAVREFLDASGVELDATQVREYFAGRANIYDRNEARKLANRLQKQVAKAAALEEALQNGDVKEMRRVCRRLGLAIHDGQAIIDAQNAAILAMLDDEIAELEAELGEKPKSTMFSLGDQAPRARTGERATPERIPESGKARLERLRALRNRIANAENSETREAGIREYARARLASEQAKLQNIIGKTHENAGTVPSASTPELEEAERELRHAEREEREARGRGEQNTARQEQKRLERLRERVAALEKQVLDAQEGFFQNDMPKMKKRRAMTDEEAALVQRVAELRHTYRTLLDAKFPGEQLAEERAIRARQRAIQRSIEHLQNKMEGSEQAQNELKKDYSNDPRLDDLKKRLREKKQQYLEWEAAQKWKSMSTGGKALKTVADFFDLTKSLVASGDLSAIWTQCGWMMLGNPRLNVRAVRDGLRSLFSGKQSEEIMNKLARDYDLQRFVEDGLEIHAVGTAAESEMFARDSNPLLNKLIPQDNKLRKLGGMWLEASARGFDTPINIIRATTYAAALDACQKHGKMLGKEERQTLAQLINYATGTGDMKFFKQGVFKRLLWAPSRISGQIQTIQNMVNLGLSSIGDKFATQKFKNFDLDVRRAMFWQVYGKSLANYMALTAVMYALSRLMWDDDDDDKRLVGKEFFNPLSAQFLKYNLGGNYFAPLGGIEIYLRTAARTAAGGRTDRYGRFKQFDGYQNGSTTDELLTTFVMNKLSPTMQLAAAALNREAKFETLETPGQIMQYVVQNTIYPLTMHDSVEAFAEHGIPTGAALTLMNFVGLSSWSYGHVKRDTAVRDFNASLKAYNEFAKAGDTAKLRELMNRYDWLKPQYRVRLVNLAGQYKKLAARNKEAVAAGRANGNMMTRQAQLAEQIYAIMHEAETR